MPAAALADRNIVLATGSDIGAGSGLGIYRQISRTVQLSKLKWHFEPEENKPVTFANAFCMATRTGGSLFGKTGAFDQGYHFNALVIDGMEDKGFPLSPAQVAERFCYMGNTDNIKARYLDGIRL